MRQPVRILYLEDQPEDVELVTHILDKDYLPCELTWVNGRDAYLSALRDGWNFDLLLVDYALPDIGGKEALDLARERVPNLPFIFLSGSLGEERAVECLRQGATDYVLKTNLPRLVPVARRALEEAREARARREAEASHARVASLLRAALESTSEGILVVDLAGRISAYNRKFLSLCGIPDFVMAPMEMDGVIQYLTGQFGNPGALLEEARLLRSRSDKDYAGILSLKGSRILEATSRPHKVGPETVGRVLSVREPQDRAEASELLKAIGAGRHGFSEATLAARVAPWYLVEDRFVVPEGAAAILGVSSPPTDLKGLVELLHPEDADQLKEALERSQNVSFKARGRRADGTWQWLRWNVDRGPEGHRGVFMDITEQQWQLERQLQRKRLEGARECARRLSGRLHEKLGACRRELELLDLPPEQERALAGPMEEMEGFLGQVRAFAQLGRPAFVSAEPDAFMEAFLSRARKRAGHGAQLLFRAAGGLPEVRLDPAQMEQALEALLRNALEALGGAGTIEFATALLKPRPYRRGAGPGPMKSRVAIEVRDGGPGIPPGLHRQVFEPFFTTRLEGNHAGLGLALVREIVAAHDGSIQLESAPRAGTVLRILLPV